MKTSYVSTSATAKKTDLLIVPCFEDKQPTKPYAYASALEAGMIDGHFKGEAGQVAMLAGSKDTNSRCVALLGLGKAADFTLNGLRNGLSAIMRNDLVCSLKLTSCTIDASHFVGEVSNKEAHTAPGSHAESAAKQPTSEWLGEAMVEGCVLGSYVYTELFGKNEKRIDAHHRLSSLTIACAKSDLAGVKKGGTRAEAESYAVNYCRDLVNKPNSHLRPGHLARAAEAAAEKIEGLTCKVLDKKALQKLNMGSFLSVNAGSGEGDSAARLIILTYNGGKKGDAPLCFVGKGLTFDTGGYSLKPAASMLGMKWDMGGAGTVLGAIMAIAGMTLPINCVCLIGATENLVNEEATKPGDVVTSMSGITIEVNNTDAEGRLVLCDVLTYAQQQYKPETIVDCATLTGAVLIALGDQVFGVLTNDDGVAKELEIASKDAGEHTWRLPLPEIYDKYLDSDIADVSNIGGAGKAGTVTAGLFLQRFIDKGQKWAHLDIAGVANNEGKQGGVVPAKGGTGTGVRTLVNMARNRCAK